MTASPIEIRDPAVIERFARRDPALHLYELGDLDPFFWPNTTWFGLSSEGSNGEDLSALALLYTGPSVPTFIALGREDGGAVLGLVEAVATRLPALLYAHLSPGGAARLGPRWKATFHGRHLKMEHRCSDVVRAVAWDDVERLGPSDHDEVIALYRRAYPGNWFDARMLETQQYFGIRRDRELACVAGIHVYSPKYGVAALGNVTTDPKSRGQGLARRACARLCASLYEDVTLIGLNVEASNAVAIACYEGLGFVTVAEYEEWMLEPA